MAREAYRLSIDGVATEFVTDAEMAVTADDGRVRRVGLVVPKDLVLEQSVSPQEAALESEPVQVRVIDEDHTQYASGAFWKSPEQTTWLTTSVTPSTDTIRVLSTAGFTGLSVVHVVTEAVGIGGTVGGTAFTSVTRGKWGTVALSHYAIGGGAGQSFPPCDSHPFTIKGRRARLYRYVLGTDDLSDTAVDAGTPWVGYVQGDARFDAGAYNLTIGSLWKLTDQPIGTGLGTAVYPRGIAFHQNCYIEIRIDLLDGPWMSDLPIVGQRVQVRIPRDLTTATAHFETQEDLADPVNTLIQDSLSALTANPPQLRMVPFGAEGYTWQFKPNSTTARSISLQVSGPADGEMSCQIWSLEVGNEDAVPNSGQVTANDVYYPTPRSYKSDREIPGVRTVPRGLYGAGAQTVDLNLSSETRRLYVGGAAPIEDDTKGAQIHWPEVYDKDEAEWFHELTGVTAAQRSFVAKRDEGVEEAAAFLGTDLGRPYTRELLPEIRLVNVYHDAENIGDFVDEITDDAPVEVNRGTAPGLFDSDFDQTEIDDVVGRVVSRRELLKRQYRLAKKVKLRELLEQELRLAGLFPYLKSGKISFREFKIHVSTDPSVTTIGSGRVVWNGADRPSISKYTDGLLQSVTLKTGYDEIEDEHTGRTFQIVNVQARSRDPSGKDLAVEPFSSARGRQWQEIEYEQATELFTPKLGTWGNPYVIVEFTARIDDLDTNPYLPGDGVRVTLPSLPNTETGTRGKRGVGGIQGRTGTILSTRWEPRTGRVRLRVFLSELRTAGYAPSAGVTSQTNVSGNTWNVNTRMGDPLGKTSWSDNGMLDDFIGQGYRVILKQWATSTLNDVQASVVSVAGNTARVKTGSTWTPGSDLWTLELDTSTWITEEGDQSTYCYFGDNEGRVAYNFDLSLTYRRADEYSP